MFQGQQNNGTNNTEHQNNRLSNIEYQINHLGKQIKTLRQQMQQDQPATNTYCQQRQTHSENNNNAVNANITN